MAIGSGKVLGFDIDNQPILDAAEVEIIDGPWGGKQGPASRYGPSHIYVMVNEQEGKIVLPSRVRLVENAARILTQG